MSKYIEQLKQEIEKTKEAEARGEQYTFDFNYEKWRKQDFIDMMTDLQELWILKYDRGFSVDIHHCQLN